MATEQYIRLGRQTALISFLLGTVIFGLYFQTSSSDLLFAGYIFIVITSLLNFGLLFLILLKAVKDKVGRNKLFTTSGLMLLNIPVMIFYCWFATILLDTMRLTFSNATHATLTNINVIGCETEHIDQLEAGQSKTVWVGITGDCSIYLEYIINGERKKESIVGYVTTNMGRKLKHNIGGENKDLF